MAEPFIISGLSVYTEHGVSKKSFVEVANGHIRDIGRSKKMIAKKKLRFPESYHLLPGFIDLHVHGANGKDVMDASPEALASMCAVLAAEGVTGFLATTMTAPIAQIESALTAVRDYRQQPVALGAKILGVHLEGPFISPEKAGAQHREHILPLSMDYIAQWQLFSGNTIKIVTLAPELPGSEAFIKELIRNDIVASMGHTNATYAEAMAAITAGCSQATHLFNAMRPIHQREPGVIAAALLANDVSVELIADGVHVHPALFQMAMRIKAHERMILVTDAMRAQGLPDGDYELGGQKVAVLNGAARLADGTLAGSTLKLSTALKNMMKFTGCHLMDAVKMTSENPAKVLGVFAKKGSIAIGKEADLVVLDDELNVVLTVVEGEILEVK